MSDTTIYEGCCGDDKWRGRHCQYHQGFEDGQEAAEGKLAALTEVLEILVSFEHETRHAHRVRGRWDRDGSLCGMCSEYDRARAVLAATHDFVIAHNRAISQYGEEMPVSDTQVWREADPRHPHETSLYATPIPRTLDGEGRCVVCVLLNRAEAAEGKLAALTELLADVVKAHEAITARFRAGTTKPPPEWAFAAMDRARAVLAAPQEGDET